MSSISIEQAVYGSFPFWERGYAVLGRSPGCRDEWVEAFTSACTRFGERPREVSRAAGLFALRAGSEVWMIVGVRGQGEDDQGRPGALAFHALFVSDADYRRCGASPFPFARWHREDWGPETGSLPSLSVSIRGLEDEPPATLASRQADLDSRAGRVARVLSRGRRVAVVADRPIDDLAQAVWGALSVRQKGQKTLATWAFGVGNGFDLVGLPERPNLVMPEGYVGEADLEERPRPAPSRPAGRTWAVWRSAGLLAAAVGLSALAGAWYARTGSRVERIEPERESVAVEPETPEPPAVRPVSIDQEARRRITERLRDLSHRFGIGTGETSDDAAFWMRRMASELRYRGALLSEADLVRLRSERAAGRARALAWDEQIRRFVPDRPLPKGFEGQPLNGQLSTFAWSFHVPIDPRLTPEEIPQAVGYALAVDGPIRSNPLSDRYPILQEYVRFLQRLPRR